MENRFGDINTNDSIIFVCDIQERFSAVIHNFEELSKKAKIVVTASSLLNIPLLVTEQYPKGLGKTIKELDISHHEKLIEKTDFTMCVSEVMDYLNNAKNIRNIILLGVETHVCIQQTVIDLLKLGYQVHILADATSSRNFYDKEIALQRFSHSGAIVTTTEAVLFQLIRSKNHPNFKEIQNLIK